MSLNSKLVVLALFAAATALPARAQPEPSHTRFGAEKAVYDFTKIQIRNFQDESLGRITDLGIDLVNGRIVEVLVVSDSSLDVGNKIVAVPPLALIPDQFHEIYRVNISAEAFKTAAAIDLSKWTDAGRSDRVAAAYRLFRQEPYFLEEGQSPAGTDRPKVPLGYVERSSKILDLSVGNFQNERFGKVHSMSMDIPRGQIAYVVVLAPGNFRTKTIIPATALSFNPARNGLLLDATKVEFRDEPRYIFTAATRDRAAFTREESYKGPRTSDVLEQGTSYRDVDRTVAIHQQIRAAKIDGRHVEIGTNDGRVTLRGWVSTIEDKNRINEIAVAASRLELVDNQIVVGKPVNGD